MSQSEFYTIGDISRDCSINPVTLRAWQRRYGLITPHRTPGGHRLYSEADRQKILEIKRWIESGLPPAKVKALLDGEATETRSEWVLRQDELLSVLRDNQPARLRQWVYSLGKDNPAGVLIDQVFLPVRQRLMLNQHTAAYMSSLLDGILIDYVSFSLAATRKRAGEDALLIGWSSRDRLRLWLESWRLTEKNWRVTVLAEPLKLTDPQLLPHTQIFLWTDNPLTRVQQNQLAEWQKSGYKIEALHRSASSSSPLRDKIAERSS